jgi:hypothetical protein
MQSLVENKPYFFKKYYFILYEVGFFFHQQWVRWSIDGMVLLGIAHDQFMSSTQNQN